MKPVRAALYLRLSREDGDREGDSQSICNQRDFLLDYCAQNGMEPTATFVDDGWSGTNFDRPGFRAMLADIEAGRIDTVLTKDLSRLGRDYILTGHYLERYFPTHGVRYIAVNDGVDTCEGQPNNDLTPFRSVFNDLYARDISKKVRTALDTRRREGKFIGSTAPYGYQKDPADRSRLVIDSDTAPTVRQIYEWFLAGETLRGIVRRLDTDEVPTPSAAKNSMAKGRGGWNETMLRRILTNPTYTGALTQNRSRKINYKVARRVNLPPEEWVVVRQTHAPIVTEQIFEAVGRRLQSRVYDNHERGGAPHPFTGLAFCADCGAPMASVRESPSRTYLVCGGWRRHAKENQCLSHCVREDAVLAAVAARLRELAAQVDTEQIYRACADRDRTLRGERRMARLESGLEQCHTTLLNLYRDRADGTLTPGEYSILSETLCGEREALERQLARQREEGAREQNAETLHRMLDELLRFERPDRETLRALVGRVLIHSDKSLTLELNFPNPERLCL